MNYFSPPRQAAPPPAKSRFARNSLGYVAALCLTGAFAQAVAQTPAPAHPEQPAQSQQPKAAPAPAAVPAPQKGVTPASVLDDKDIETVLGREIYSSAGEDMGRIVDILVDHHGGVRAAIIDFGGFLGVGSRKIAVDWRAIQFGQDRAISSLTRDQIRVAPEYKPGEPVVVVGPESPSAPRQQNTKPAATAPAK